jgi:hypothetical protein
VGGLALAAAVALAIGWSGRSARDHGEAVAARRTEVHLGERAVGVLEPGAHVRWDGDAVTQTEGDVFYRVERGGAYRVMTPAGEVDVLGTCFRVQVRGAEEAKMNGRDVAMGAVGAALGAAVLVTVYEGKVALSHEGARVTLTAGESGAADAKGVRSTGGPAPGDEANGGASPNALEAANANLADSVRDYKRRLEAIETEKSSIATQLAAAQAKLATAANDGQAVAAKSSYDLDQNDWKQMAANGEARSRTACADPDSWKVGPKTLNALGLAPQDAQPIEAALAASAKRIWAVVRPLCIQALQGDAAMADKLGQGTCQALVHDVARQKEDTDEEVRAVAEMRAGLRPMDPSALGTFGQVMYAMTGETKAIEQDLAQSIGPDDARRFTYGDQGSWCQSAWTSGPRPVTPPPH